MEPRKPADEQERLRDLYQYPLLGHDGKKVYQDITQLTTEICRTPTACISILDQDHEWMLACHGVANFSFPRKDSFCAHAILEPKDVFIVPDAQKDERFADNPYVKTGDVRFYAGAPLTTPQGHPLGMLCVVDNKPRELDDGQRKALKTLASHTMRLFEFQRTLKETEDEHEKLQANVRELEHRSSTRLDTLRASFHDLSSPLTVLRTQVALLERALQTNDGTADKRLELIKNSLHQVQRLTDDIHNNLKDGRTRLEITLEPLDLKPLLEETLAGFKDQAREQSVRLHLDTEDGLQARGDHDRIHQVVSNLLSNALKFTSFGGQIRITARPREPEQDLLVQMTDSGIGLSADETNLIFQPFVQLKGKNDAHARPGSGLGLSIAKRLIEAQGGTIWATSPGRGKGCTFSFTLPLAKADKAASRQEDSLQHHS